MSTKPKKTITAEAEEKTKVSNSAKLDPKNPIPLEQNGMGFYSRAGGMYIPFLDKFDNMASTLLEAKLLSPTTLSVINSKVTFCGGGGYKLFDVEKDESFDEWAKVVNKKGQSFNDILKSIFDNFFSFGNVYVDVVIVEIGTTKYIKLFVKSFLDCRLEEPEDGSDVSENVFVSKEFRKSGMWMIKDEQCMKIPIYTGEKGQEWFTDKKGHKHAIIYLKNDTAGFEHYGLPSNVGSLPQQILEYKGARYNLDNFDNNLVIGGAVILQGSMSQEEADKTAKKIVNTHSGDGKRGRWTVISTESGIENSKIENFKKQEDGDFIQADERLEEKIILANDWSKTLMDPQSSGIGESSKQIKEIFEVKKAFVIEPAQAFVIEKFVMPLMDICDSEMKTKWASHQFGLNIKSPVSFIGDLDVNGILTIDEGREMIGRLPMEDTTIGKSIIAPAKQKGTAVGGLTNV